MILKVSLHTLYATHLLTVLSIDILGGIQDMVGQDGLRALWRGLPPTLWRDVPFSAIYWMGYETCKRHIESSVNELEASFLAGAVSGMVGFIVDY